MESFGQRLRKVRIENKLTQVALAEKVGAYQSKYRNWESDINEPDLDTINRLADILGVSADWLLGRAGTEKPYPTEFDKEMFMLREEIKQYGPESIKRLRKMLPLIFDKPQKKVSYKTVQAATSALKLGRQALTITQEHPKKKKRA